METNNKAFLVNVKMSCTLRILNGMQVDVPYGGIIQADSKQACLEELIKKIGLLIEEGAEKKTNPSLLEIRVGELSAFGHGELMNEIIFSWDKKVGYLPDLDPYKLMEFLVSSHEKFLKQHNISPICHDDLPFKD